MAGLNSKHVPVFTNVVISRDRAPELIMAARDAEHRHRRSAVHCDWMVTVKRTMTFGSRAIGRTELGNI